MDDAVSILELPNGEYMLKHRKSTVERPPEGCALSVCVHYLRGAWTPGILWYLGNRPRRFSELKRDLGGISAKVLTQRLRRLEADGLVAKEHKRTSPPSIEYALTDLGLELQPALSALVRVGRKLKERPAVRQSKLAQPSPAVEPRLQ